MVALVIAWLMLAYLILPALWSHYEHQPALESAPKTSRTAQGIPGDPLNVGLIGCGGRGSGAVVNAMNSAFGPVKLVAMADVAPRRLTSAHKILSEQFGDRVDVPKDRQFVGFDAYKKAIDCLGPGDVAMLTNFSAFRPMQLEYAVVPDELLGKFRELLGLSRRDDHEIHGEISAAG